MAFNTIDRGILSVYGPLGLDGTVLHWFGSFIQGWSQSVLIRSERSSPQPLSCGIPQGLVLPPLVFNIYIKRLSEIICHYGLRYHQYPDDTQLYSSNPGDPSDAIVVLLWYLETVGDGGQQASD